jgi:ADP-heptose:LPS heptosyltransferase
MSTLSNDIAIILNCQGMGDCLFAIPVIKKLKQLINPKPKFAIFSYHPNLFINCPYIDVVHDIHNSTELSAYRETINLFDSSKLPYFLFDTFDFMSIPIGLGTLSYKEKQLEYFPVEEDCSEHFDVVINTSNTWPSRSWPIENWQRVADFILARGYSVSVVGKDIWSDFDNMLKKSLPLKNCSDLTNLLSLDQTFYTIRKSSLFITCQNGLSVLSGATDTEIIVLGMSIEWSKRAIYRNENPFYKVSYIKGNCDIYCCAITDCEFYKEFQCIPTVEQVLDIVGQKLCSIKKESRL